MNTQIDLNKITSSVYKKKKKNDSINELTSKLNDIVNSQNDLRYKWLSKDKIVEALKLMLSICHKSNLDLNTYIKIMPKF